MLTHASAIPSSETEYEILPWRGEFRDPGTEQAYRANRLQRTQTSLRIAFALCSALYLCCWIADLRVAGFTADAYYGLLCRATFAVSSVVLLYWLKRYPKSVELPERIACIGTVIGCAVYEGLALSLPGEIPTLEIATLLVTLSIYMAAPNRLQWSIIFSAAYGLIFLLIAYSKPQFTVDLTMEALYLVATNFACWVIALRQNILMRADFRSKLRMREQAAKDHLRIVLLEEQLQQTRAARGRL